MSQPPFLPRPVYRDWTPSKGPTATSLALWLPGGLTQWKMEGRKLSGGHVETGGIALYSVASAPGGQGAAPLPWEPRMNHLFGAQSPALATADSSGFLWLPEPRLPCGSPTPAPSMGTSVMLSGGHASAVGQMTAPERQAHSLTSRIGHGDLLGNRVFADVLRLGTL